MIGAAVGAGLYLANPSNHGDNFSWGELALATGVAAAAGATIATIPGAIAAGSITAGTGLAVTSAAIGASASGAGYMAGSLIAGSDFESVDFAIATGTGAVSGAAGPTVATTQLGAAALGAASGLAQYEFTKYAHTREFALDEGAGAAVFFGGLGGAVGGSYPSTKTLFNTAISNPNPLNRLNGFDPVYGSPYGNAHTAITLWRLTARQNLWRGLTGGIVSNWPVKDEE